MSSSYPILDNRPLDQWKVVELKEELKRRKLITKGLKDDLIKRLDEALRVERENAERENEERENSERENEERENADRENEERENADRENEIRENADKENVEREKEEREIAEIGNAESKIVEMKDSDKAVNGFNCDPQPISGTKDAETAPVVDETVEDLVEHGGNKNEKVVGVTVKVDINEPVADLDQEKCQEGDVTGDSNTDRVELLVVQETNVETSTSVAVTESMVSEVALSGQELQNSGIQEENDDSSIQLENEGLKPQPTDDLRDLRFTSAPNNQVSEVSPVLGFQVKSDSISTDSVSINEKIELKDNIIADNVKLEQDFVKPEMVEPSSSDVVPVVGESHPMDVEEPFEKKASVEERDDNNATNADITNKSDSADVGYSEKLNLDRSSGDDSMEEDVMESKQIESKYSSDDVRNKSEKSGMPVVKEESHVDVVGDGISADKNDIRDENKRLPAVHAEKRKLRDQEAVANNEPIKRQRRWNSETIKVPEPRGSSITPTTTPKDNFQLTALKRNFSRSDSSASEGAPKERVVLQSQKAPTNTLRIDRFLRPFTLKAVQELLGKTGTVTSFWMDHIKTHCYVTYSSVEEAIETRNAVYNLQWPQNGGRLLVAEFVDPQEVKMRVEALPTPSKAVSYGTTVPTAQPTLAPQPHQKVPRQQLPPPPSALPPPPPLSDPPPVRERLILPPPPPLPDKQDPPIVTLDDLFRKTKATPRIYYLPLSEEQVAAKLAVRGRNTK